MQTTNQTSPNRNTRTNTQKIENTATSIGIPNKHNARISKTQKTNLQNKHNNRSQLRSKQTANHKPANKTEMLSQNKSETHPKNQTKQINNKIITKQANQIIQNPKPNVKHNNSHPLFKQNAQAKLKTTKHQTTTVTKPQINIPNQT